MALPQRPNPYEASSTLAASSDGSRIKWQLIAGFSVLISAVGSSIIWYLFSSMDDFGVWLYHAPLGICSLGVLVPLKITKTKTLGPISIIATSLLSVSIWLFICLFDYYRMSTPALVDNGGGPMGTLMVLFTTFIILPLIAVCFAESKALLEPEKSAG